MLSPVSNSKILLGLYQHVDSAEPSINFLSISMPIGWYRTEKNIFVCILKVNDERCRIQSSIRIRIH